MGGEGLLPLAAGVGRPLLAGPRLKAPLTPLLALLPALVLRWLEAGAALGQL